MNDLQRTEEDAKVQFQTQRNQVDADEARKPDNAALRSCVATGAALGSNSIPRYRTTRRRTGRPSTLHR